MTTHIRLGGFPGMLRGPTSFTTSTPIQSAYSCLSGSCSGSGDYQTLFLQLEDLLDKAHAKARTMSGGTYLGPVLNADGVIDQATAQSLRALSDSGYAKTLIFVDVPLTPDFIAQNAQDIVNRLATFVNGPKASIRNLFTKQAIQIQPTQTTGGGNTITTGGDSGSGTTTTVVDYGCPDGSRVSDPSMCPSPTVITDPGGGYIDPSGGGSTDPGIMPPVTNPMPTVVVGLSPIGKFALAALGILAGVAGAAVVIHHHNQSGQATER